MSRQCFGLQRLGKVVFAPRLFRSRRLAVVNIKIHETLCDILLCAACHFTGTHATIFALLRPTTEVSAALSLHVPCLWCY